MTTSSSPATGIGLVTGLIVPDNRPVSVYPQPLLLILYSQCSILLFGDDEQMLLHKTTSLVFSGGGDQDLLTSRQSKKSGPPPLCLSSPYARTGRDAIVLMWAYEMGVRCILAHMTVDELLKHRQRICILNAGMIAGVRC